MEKFTTTTEFRGNPKPFGVIGLVITIIAFLFSFIPCVGFYSIGPAILGVIFCLIAFLYARKMKHNSSVPLAGLIIGTLAIGVGIYQYSIYHEVYKAKKELDEAIDQEMIETVIEKLENDTLRAVPTDSLGTTNKDSVDW